MAQHDNPRIDGVRIVKAAKRGLKTLPDTAQLAEVIAVVNALLFVLYGADADVPTNKAHLDAHTKKAIQQAERAAE